MDIGPARARFDVLRLGSRRTTSPSADGSSRGRRDRATRSGLAPTAPSFALHRAGRPPPHLRPLEAARRRRTVGVRSSGLVRYRDPARCDHREDAAPGADDARDRVSSRVSSQAGLSSATPRSSRSCRCRENDWSHRTTRSDMTRAICTTEHNSGWSPSRWTCAWPPESCRAGTRASPNALAWAGRAVPCAGRTAVSPTSASADPGRGDHHFLVSEAP
jgi:hypothetical protein